MILLTIAMNELDRSDIWRRQWCALYPEEDKSWLQFEVGAISPNIWEQSVVGFNNAVGTGPLYEFGPQSFSWLSRFTPTPDMPWIA